MVPVTAAPPAPVRLTAAVPDWSGSLKVAVTVLPIETPVAPAAGVRPVTVGGVVSAGGAAAVVKTQITETIVLPAGSWAPETLAVYVVDAANALAGAHVTERVPGSYVGCRPRPRPAR